VPEEGIGPWVEARPSKIPVEKKALLLWCVDKSGNGTEEKGRGMKQVGKGPRFQIKKSNKDNLQGGRPDEIGRLRESLTFKDDSNFTSPGRDDWGGKNLEGFIAEETKLLGAFFKVPRSLDRKN